MGTPHSAGSARPGTGLNHIELAAPDADEAAAELARRYGLRVLAERRGSEGRTLLLGANAIVLLVTEGPCVADYVDAHGTGVRDIALRTPDAARRYAAWVAAGATGVSPPSAVDGGGVVAVVEAFGDVVHSLVQPPGGAPSPWLPGFGPVTVPQGVATCLETVDHLAVCLGAGELTPTVARYERFGDFRLIFTERIEVGDQAMLSQVVQSDSGEVTLTLIEPDTTAAPGQIDRFLRDHGGAGVQHVAFSSPNVVRSVAVLRERGVEFLSTPDAYYDLLASRLRPARHPVAELRELSLLVDEDHDGQLYQIFTRSRHPRGTLFYEVIERLGASTFGSGNITALYEAVEQEALAGQVRR
ncbi:4-hydroxyphenylpyruvate dioxygenase [Saccharomonospora piscinae]|uniref:4-hydroxyphenylpyruvate dioxygenase n=1 Tax=Saccharomonospora piscinae TaxID=687388 RepID=UPI0004676C95|nr:4-hydroxyphenylpyruvate dioxygenase [Saccharomonospora piscinae]